LEQGTTPRSVVFIFERSQIDDTYDVLRKNPILPAPKRYTPPPCLRSCGRSSCGNSSNYSVFQKRPFSISIWKRNGMVRPSRKSESFERKQSFHAVPFLATEKHQIGRASCRERVYIFVGGGTVKKKSMTLFP